MAQSPDGKGAGNEASSPSKDGELEATLGKAGDKDEDEKGGLNDYSDLSISEKAAELLEFEPKSSKVDSTLLQPLALLDADAEHIEDFSEEYKRLQTTLRMSYESETRFINKCKGLISKIRTSSTKLTSLALHLKRDQKKKELAKKAIEANRAENKAIREEVSQKRKRVKALKAELEALQEQLENSTNDSIQKQRQVIDGLVLDVAKQTAIRDKDRAELTKIRTKNIDLFNKWQNELAKQKKGQEDLDNLDKKISEINAQSAKEIRRKAELKRTMQDLKKKVDEAEQTICDKKAILEDSQQGLERVKETLAEREEVQNEHLRDIDRLVTSTAGMNQKVSDCQEENDQAERFLKKMQKALDAEIKAVKQAAKGKMQKKKMLQMVTQKLFELSRETAEAEQLKIEWQEKMQATKDDLMSTQTKLNSNSKQMDKCVRDREVLSQKHLNKIDSIRMKEMTLKIKRSTLKNIKNEHQGYLVSIRNLTRIIENLKRDKAVHEADLNKRQVQKARALEEVAERELKISQFQQQILVNESKLRQQQNLLEAVRSDRNLYRKSLIEQKNEMQEFKRKYSNLNMQIKQLKQEISEKDIGFVTEHFSLEQVKNEIKNFKAQNDSLELKIKDKEEIIKNSTLKIRKLTTIIADADEELRVQTKQFNAIVNEQRVLNQQLIKRNEELATLYEQLKLQNSELNKGSAHYNDKMHDLRKIGESRDNLITRLDEIMNDLTKYEELKATISHFQHELIEEKLKTKALTDELKKPINIHRWRRLMDTNTDTYGMIKRVRTLQKQIITKSSEVEKKDAAIQEKEKLYVDLRKVLARQPGSEAAEQLRLYAATLREKKAKFKQMKSELKMYQAKVYEYKYELQKLSQDLQMVKLDYFSMRRRENAHQKQRVDYDDIKEEEEDDQPIQPYQGVPPSED